MKHALWLRLLSQVTQGRADPLEAVDTHAGSGLYDLDGPMSQKSGEAVRGIARLMAADRPPAALAALRTAVEAENPGGGLRFYPGSPVLTLGALRPQDRYRGWELRKDDQMALQTLLQRREPRGRAVTLCGDGYVDLARSEGARRVFLVDPPFERGDEASQIIEGVGRALRSPGGATVALWAPLKDLETFDSLLRALEALGPRSLTTAEVRLRPLWDPMRLNGSAMIFLDGPDLSQDSSAVCEWVARTCGETGAEGRVRRLIR